MTASTVASYWVIWDIFPDQPAAPLPTRYVVMGLPRAAHRRVLATRHRTVGAPGVLRNATTAQARALVRAIAAAEKRDPHSEPLPRMSLGDALTILGRPAEARALPATAIHEARPVHSYVVTWRVASDPRAVTRLVRAWNPVEALQVAGIQNLRTAPERVLVRRGET